MPDDADPQTGTAPSPGDAPLRGWEKLSLLALLVVFLGFGYLTLLRSAYYDTRMTDFGVYARAAWALRTNHDLYATVDDNGWHYVYPPPFAFLFLPFADPPSGADRTGYMSYPLGVAIWYIVSLLLVGYAAHTFAQVVVPEARRWSRRWWYARLIPFDVCIGGIGFSLARGQANVLLVAVIAAGFAAAMRGRSIRSGFWFGAAIVLKIFPGLLLAFPLVRRDWRAAFGVFAAALILCVGFPALLWGPVRAVEENIRFVQTVVMPGLGGPVDPALAEELHNMTAKPSQSFMAILHYTKYPSPDGRPNQPEKLTKLIHWSISFGIIVVTLWAAIRLPRPMQAPQALVFLGALVVAMIMIVPMSHMHYYSIVHPCAAGLWLRSVSRHPNAPCGDPATLTGLLAWMVLSSIPLFPGETCAWLRDHGLALYSTFGLWVWSIVALRQDAKASALTTSRPTPVDGSNA